MILNYLKKDLILSINIGDSFMIETIATPGMSGFG